MKKILYTLFVLFVSLQMFAQIPDRPKPAKLVNDFAKVFDNSEVYALESRLENFAITTSTQIVLVTVSSLNGDAPWSFAHEILNEWGVGQEDIDNGIVILIKPKTPTLKGDAYIATGYGIEAIVPDAIAKLVVENEMIPKFKQENMYGGVLSGLNVLEELSLEEYPASEYRKKVRREERIGGSISTIVFILIFVFSIFNGARRRGRSSIGRSSLPAWILLSMLGSGRSHSGSFGNFSSGGGSFGGGGFGGFGGGASGGGGAGGSW